LVALKNVTEDNDLMIINKSGIAIRLSVSDIKVIGRATQGVRLINLEKRHDEIASVCKVLSESAEEEVENQAQAEAEENEGMPNLEADVSYHKSEYDDDSEE
jgi:DNA gyrase subunit A